MSRSWDVFCRVIDNFGDAAVCWRLARQLAAEHGGRVRMWIDSLAPLAALDPQVGADLAAQVVAGVTILKWEAGVDFGAPAEIAVEAFGCGLPDSYVDSMAARNPAPAWVILEYLSAESWVATHHGLPSPHPRRPLMRYFFFPGFAPGTGGVLRETGLESRRQAFVESPAAQAAFWERLGFSPTGASGQVVSLFAYENAVAAALLDAWSTGREKVVAAVPRSRLRPQVCGYLGASDPGDGATLTKGSLEVRFLPFLPQPEYDELLWACDWNFVRGEDSFVRAQWAQRPFVWHIYPQQEEAHRIKLDAFLDAYCGGLDPGLTVALRRFWHGWNGSQGSGVRKLSSEWNVLASARARFRAHADAWAARLALPGDLAGNLAQYCEERLK